ncbi:MAG: heavy-metal-associated domain-containing protein [Acidithiobacillus sp.]
MNTKRAFWAGGLATLGYEKRQAIVAFDDTETAGKALTRATTDAGYPSMGNWTRK